MILRNRGDYCERCGVHGIDAHHIVPRADGGADEVENLHALCVACHKEWHQSYEGNLSFDRFLTESIPSWINALILKAQMPWNSSYSDLLGHAHFMRDLLIWDARNHFEDRLAESKRRRNRRKVALRMPGSR